MIKLKGRFEHPTDMIVCSYWLHRSDAVRLHLRYRYKSLLWVLAICISYLLLAQCAEAQPGQATKEQEPDTAPQIENILSSYEGQNVTSISVAGQPGADISKFESLFIQKAGTPFSREQIDQTITALKTSGHFDKVQIHVSPEVNGVRVLLVPEPAVYFGIFEFPGAGRFAYSRLIQIADYPPKAPYNADDVELDRQSLLTFFRQQGYFQAEVTPEVKVDQSTRIANIFFHVTLHTRAKFGAIDIENAAPEEVAKLSKSLQSLKARFRNSAIRPGKTYRHGALDKATQFLTNRLEDDDHLGARVKLAGAEYHADTNRADIHFNVDPGPLTYVRVEGVHLFSWKKKSLLPLYQGISVDEESVEEGRQALVSYFEAKGFFDVVVTDSFDKQSSGDTVVYKVTKGKKHKVTEVQLAGNKELSTDTLFPRIAVQKSHLFSPGKFSDKLVRASVKNIQAVYQSEGFSSAEVTSAVKNQGGDIKVSFTVTEGPRDIVNSLQIEGADTFPAAKYAPQGLKLAAGKPYSQAFVESDRAGIIANYLKAGYLTSSFRETATTASKSDPHHINVVYHIYEGPQVFANRVITLGRVRTSQRLIDKDTASIQPAQPLTKTALLTAESQMYEHTGVFDWAEIDPKREITTQTKEDVLVKVHEAKRNQMTYGFGFEIINRGGSVPSGTVSVPGLPPVGLPPNFTTDEKTFYGPRGTFQYTRNNLGGKGESLSFTAFAGRLDQRGAVYYIDPNFLWTSWRATASFSVEQDAENPIYSAVQLVTGFQLQRYLDKAKKDSFFVSYSFNNTDLTRIEIPELVPPEDQHVKLSTIAANLTRDTRDNALDEHKGVLQSVELGINPSKLGSNVDFVELNGQAAYYKQVTHKIVLANSIRIGLAQPYAGSFVPLSEAFFTGGSNTLRGFPLDGAGPQRQVQVCSTGSSTDCSFIQVPSGGNELLLLNSEVRIPVPFKKNLSIVPFYDGGNVFPRVGFHDFTALYSNNVGLGLRYSTPIGPIRIDVGHNLNPVPGINSTQYFFTIGQAF
jgi:outer membrane protein insertion porin family